MQTLDALIGRLTADLEASGTWSATPEEVASLLGVDPVTFWRAVHGVRDRIGFADAVDGWTRDSVGDLVTVLESLYGREAEERLSRAGLFVPWSVGVALIEELLFRGRRLAAAHELQTEELESMLRHTGSVRKAVEIYLETHVDLEAMIDECAESFRVLQGLPPAGRRTATAWLRRMVERHVVDRAALLVGLQERLRLAAARLGYIDPEDRARAARDGGRAAQRAPASRHEWACKVMGFAPGGFTPEALRARYRQLMMRTHPDADPAGLERCKDVNVAYSLLITEAAAR